MGTDTIVEVRPAGFTAARAAAGYSIRELANRAGVNRATVGHLATYSRRATTGGPPYIRTGRTTITAAAAIAEALGHDLHELFTHTNGDRIHA